MSRRTGAPGRERSGGKSPAFDPRQQSRDSLASARQRLIAAARHLDVAPELVQRLSYARKTLAASLPVRRDDGSPSLLKAWRCRYDDTRGPAKGGVRFHPTVCLQDAMTMALRMTPKCAVADLPFGGAKGPVEASGTRIRNAS